ASAATAARSRSTTFATGASTSWCSTSRPVPSAAGSPSRARCKRCCFSRPASVATSTGVASPPSPGSPSKLDPTQRIAVARTGARRTPMKFGLMFANVGPFNQPAGLTSLAQPAEANGIESLWTVEHVAVPVGYNSRYPYSPDGKMPAPDNAPIADPVLPLVFAAAVTKKIRLGTGILILPQRHPLYVA